MSDFICNLCPRKCNARRSDVGEGFCGMPADPVLARAALHFDEEPVISGVRGAGVAGGSGAVFFSGCSLKCVFCQNYGISHEKFGRKITVEQLKNVYRQLIAQGANNINLVNPTHYAKAIIESLCEKPAVPVIYNSGGYERIETLRALEGKVDVYLPDLKYIDPAFSERYSGAPDYFAYAAPALQEMLRQTGPVVIGEDGLIRKGVIVRHLILPGRAGESMRILRWIREHLPGAWVSLMAQYLPMGHAGDYPPLNRRITQAEYDIVVNYMIKLGLTDGFLQELSSAEETYIPKFDLSGVPDAPSPGAGQPELRRNI